MGPHKGHQTGLECDIGFYTKGKYRFDHYRNAYFLEQLLNTDLTEIEEHANRTVKHNLLIHEIKIINQIAVEITK